MSTMVITTKITYKYLMNKTKHDLANMFLDYLNQEENTMTETLCPECKTSIDKWADKNGFVYGECSCGLVIGDALYKMLKQMIIERNAIQQQLDDTNVAWFRDKLLLDIASKSFDEIIHLPQEYAGRSMEVLRMRDIQIADSTLQKIRK